MFEFIKRFFKKEESKYIAMVSTGDIIQCDEISEVESSSDFFRLLQKNYRWVGDGNLIGVEGNYYSGPDKLFSLWVKGK